jgi:hypothetical protein
MGRWDFKTAIDTLVQESGVTRAELALWGGSFDAARLDNFLDAWSWDEVEMPWHIWEWISDTTFVYQKGKPNAEAGEFRRPAWLERARFFGESGDLELRRAGSRYRWRFVGKPRDLNVPKDYKPTDYWAHHEAPLYPQERTVLLWGQELEGGGRWHEDRVAAAELAYPHVHGSVETGRVHLRYREYLSGGNVAAVWWVAVEPYDKEKGGR